MAYADLIQRENLNANFLMVISPRRKLSASSWTNVSGNIYYQSFDYGEVTEVTKDGSSLTLGSSTSVTSNQFYYDVDTERLYVNVSANPNGFFMVATYEMYLGTFDAHTYKDPTNSSTRVVYFEPLITSSPNIVTSTSEVIFGFSPTFSAQASCSAVTGYFNKHLYDGSFNRAQFKLYHCLEGYNPTNCKLFLKGFCQRYTFDNKTVNFSLLDSTKFFDEEYRNEDNSFYEPSDFPLLDPRYVGRPIRQVYGMVEGFPAVNIDYDSEGTTSTNRVYSLIAGDTNLGSLTKTAGGGTHTTTRTYLTSTSGLRIGDSLYNQTRSTGCLITNVSSTYVDHTTVGSAAVDGDMVKRSFVGHVKILQNGQIYEPLLGVHYNEYVDATNHIAGFEFLDSFESGLSMSTLSVNDVIFCRVYGHTNTVTKGGVAFGTDSSKTGTLCDATVILWEMLKTYAGLGESDLDGPSFAALVPSEFSLGFAVPETSSSQFPTIKEIIIDIGLSSLLSVYLNSDLKWSIKALGPLEASVSDASDDEILKDSFSYGFNYQDVISTAVCAYLPREIAINGGQGSPLLKTRTSENAIYLHKINKQKTFNSILFDETEADLLAKRLSYVLGERAATISMRLKSNYFGLELGDTITISRDRMPGFDLATGTARSRDMVVTGTEKSLTEITLKLDDQLGIQDNEGDW